MADVIGDGAPQKRPRDEGDAEVPSKVVAVETRDVPAGAPKIKTCPEAKKVMEALLNPVTVDEFRSEFWALKALHLRAPEGAQSRVAGFKRFMCDLNVATLLEESPSENIQVTMPGAKKCDVVGKPEILLVDSAIAEKLYNVGGSLYFRAPQELTEEWVPAITTAMGMNFGGYYPDGALRGETEVFVAHPGSVATDWHTDFQHNFTVQLKGERTWHFRKTKGGEFPLRGKSPHHGETSNYEQQMKVARLVSNGDCASDVHAFRPSNEFFAGEETMSITVKAGDVLYHPAGLWHRVETPDQPAAAISINFSLQPARYSDLIGDAFKHKLFAVDQLREPLTGVFGHADLLKQAEARLAAAKAAVNDLVLEDIFPAAILTPRKTVVECDKAVPQSCPVVAAQDRFVFSDMAVLIEGDRKKATSKSREFVLHSNFGNDDFDSHLRVVFKVPVDMVDTMAMLQRKEKPFVGADVPEGHRKLVQQMVFHGYVRKVSYVSL